MIIVNFSTKEFSRGQRRLAESLNGHQFVLFDRYSAIKSPSHQESPYEFKLHAMQAASATDSIVLWCDASLWLVGDLSEIETIIKRDGFFGSEAGHYAGRWTNQFTRNYFKTTEQEMTEGPGGITLFSAGLLGLDFSSEIGREFFRRWKAAAIAGCFKGNHSDHRHDQTCASIIATRMGLKYQRGGQHMAYIGEGYSKPESGAVFYLQGI